MVDKPDWAFEVFTQEAIKAKLDYYASLHTEEERLRKEKRLAREEHRVRNPRTASPAKFERNLAIWTERKSEGTTYDALGKKYGLTRERIRQIIAKEDRRRARRAYFDELRSQKQGASYGG